jgi:predicted small lipoprotein YifL
VSHAWPEYTLGLSIYLDTAMRLALLALFSLTTLAACGNKGDLYLRDPTAPPPMSAADQAAAKAAAERDAALNPPAEPQTRKRKRRRRD